MSSLIVKKLPFTLLADQKPPWRCFGAGFGLETLAVLLVVVLPLLMPQKLEMLRQYYYTPIAAPPVRQWKPQPVKLQQKFAVKPKPILVAKNIVPEPITPPKPKIMSPVFASPVAKPATAHRDTPKPDAPEVAFKPAIQHPAMGSSAIPNLRKPREQVQTGGFGDPNGLPATGSPGKAANINKLGSYDLPPVPGCGNGTGGAKGARGIVASAGFGNGVAVGGSGGSGGGGRGGAVKQDVFADQHPVAEVPKAHNPASSASKTQPVEILFKPKPVYTDLARQKRIEGEVLVEVAFSASGQVEVQRVIRGLGYGLDEAAVSAARQIRFRPAMQDGHPVDLTATVHILFELAY